MLEVLRVLPACEGRYRTLNCCDYQCPGLALNIILLFDSNAWNSKELGVGVSPQSKLKFGCIRDSNPRPCPRP